MKPDDKPAVFLGIVNDHKGIIYKVANSYCKDAERRNDLVQEIILQLWKSYDHYNSQFRYSTWIYRIALNVAISSYRKEIRTKETSFPLTESILNLPESPASDETERNIQRLQQFIAELKELDKALMLLYLDEKSHKEIAEIIGITETNVATKISRIKAVLKQKFSI